MGGRNCKEFEDLPSSVRLIMKQFFRLQNTFPHENSYTFKNVRDFKCVFVRRVAEKGEILNFGSLPNSRFGFRHFYSTLESFLVKAFCDPQNWSVKKRQFFRCQVIIFR